jgi:hypothetical protein
MRLLLTLVLAAVSFGCASTMKVTGISNYTKKQKEYLIIKYWTEAQEDLEDFTNGTSALVPHTIINRWIWSKQLLTHDVGGGKKEVFAFGDFTATKQEGLTIRLVEWRPWTIKHEACHAILYHLQKADWIEYCHTRKEFK